jgi:hypothetical protein
MKRSITALLAVLALLLAAQVPQQSGAPLLRSAVLTTLCNHGENRLVQDSPTAQAYRIRNAYWRGTRKMCITNANLHTNFTVTSRPGTDRRGLVSAYPDILRGCLWQICTPNAHIPVQVSRLRMLKSTWHTRQNARGDWNAAYDLWFGKRRMTTGQADGAELMIWLNRHGSCCRTARPTTVRIDGYKFLVTHWRHYSGKWHVSWNYIQFRMAHPRNWVTGLRLMPFINRAIRMGLVRRVWWLENVTAGFEIWRGGVGLATTKFAVSLRRR